MRPGEGGLDAQGQRTPSGTFPADAENQGENHEAAEGGDAEVQEAVPRRGGISERVRDSGGLVLLIGGVAVPALLAGGIAMAVHRGGGEESVAPPKTQPAVTSAVPRPKPSVYPTYGEYVPPRPVEKVTRPAPVTTRGSATPTPSARPPCPGDWRENPWLRRWCWRHGFDTNDS
jgi:hypothetical protein